MSVHIGILPGLLPLVCLQALQEHPVLLRECLREHARRVELEPLLAIGVATVSIGTALH
jgi:hypothetical protein